MCECIQRTGKKKIHHEDCKEGYPNPPHKHAELIIAWAKGASIECDFNSSHKYPSYLPCWRETDIPMWDKDKQYRIKLKPKPDVVISADIRHPTRFSVKIHATCEGVHPVRSATWMPNVKFTYDGETNELKSVGMI